MTYFQNFTNAITNGNRICRNYNQLGILQNEKLISEDLFQKKYGNVT